MVYCIWCKTAKTLKFYKLIDEHVQVLGFIGNTFKDKNQIVKIPQSKSYDKAYN